MCTPSPAVQLRILQERIDKAEKELADRYPFLKSDKAKAQGSDRKKRTDELALRTLRDIREKMTL